MKTLRILTGAHAGARLRLARDSYTVGGTPEADIVVTDWSAGPLRLALPHEGPAQAVPVDAPEGATAQALDDLVPYRFGNIALCVGPEDAAWPSDLQLLETLMSHREPPAVPDKRARGWARLTGRRSLMVACGSTSLVLLLAFAGLLSSNGKAAVPKEPLQNAVARAIQSTAVPGVTVHAGDDGSVSVDGMVPDVADVRRLRTALARFEHVAHRYTSGTAVAQQIADALGNPGLAVRYRADGEFLVSGASQDLESVRAKLRRVATDVGPAVTRIELQANELQPAPVLPTNALMSSEDVRYVQTRDGTKHLVIGPAASGGATR